ncbi:MAG TPA: transcription termination factor NusA [Bryobacterales bacterium]|jgi:N utilization substance protein A|nr:transcription termination factor NusA [Bryobacterales bacterium]
MATLYDSIETLSREKGIDAQIVLDAVKDAILVAARKYYKTAEDLIAELNPKTGQIDVFAVKKVTEPVTNPLKEISLEDARRYDPNAQLDSEIRIAKPTEVLGRISAQTAKQVIFQKIREAERETIFGEFSGRVGELVTCVVKRAEGPDLVVDLGKTEARLPRREQSKAESFAPGDRIRAVIKSVDKFSRGPGVVVSRAAPELVMRLFEQEVPEIYDGTVVIKACAREAGERTKIAVQSRDRDVDSVGACVGMKGMRVQSIIRELRGEKIDIIEYSEDPVELATNALSPAKISRVAIIDPMEKHLEVVVDDSQLSLAIGKKGQNVRLAAKLMGWRIDIKSEEEKRQEVESAMAALVSAGTPISVLLDHGLGEKLVEKLSEAGATTVERLSDMTPEQLEEIPGIGPKMVEKIQLAVQSYYGQFEEEQGGGEAPAPESGTEEGQAENQAAAGAEAGQEAASSVGEASGVELSASNAAPNESDKIALPGQSQAESVTAEAPGEAGGAERE